MNNSFSAEGQSFSYRGAGVQETHGTTETKMIRTTTTPVDLSDAIERHEKRKSARGISSSTVGGGQTQSILIRTQYEEGDKKQLHDLYDNTVTNNVYQKNSINNITQTQTLQVQNNQTLNQSRMSQNAQQVMEKYRNQGSQQNIEVNNRMSTYDVKTQEYDPVIVTTLPQQQIQQQTVTYRKTGGVNYDIAAEDTYDRRQTAQSQQFVTQTYQQQESRRMTAGAQECDDQDERWFHFQQSGLKRPSREDGDIDVDPMQSGYVSCNII